MITDARKQAELRKYFFKPLPLWDSLPFALWQELKALAQELFYSKKSLIYSEGSHPRSLFIIRQGRVKVSIVNNLGAEQILYFLGEGEVFGHRSIVCDEPSPVFVEAIDDCRIDAIPRYHFERLLRTSPELNAAFLYYLGHEFRVFANKISVFAQKPVAERVALALLVLDEKFNDPGQDIRVLRFTRDDLASYVGTASETLIRQLKVLKEAGAILVNGRKIFIENAGLLWERANVL